MNQIQSANTAIPQEMTSLEALRSHCSGVMPLDGRLEPWMVTIAMSEQLFDLIAQHGSPLNLLSIEPFRRNIQSLHAEARARSVDFDIYFARKANKCLSFVDEARNIGCGVDVASETELSQVLQRRVEPGKIICTAAVKNDSLLQRCVSERVIVAIDNRDELNLLQSIAHSHRQPLDFALRIGGFAFQDETLSTRFGYDIQEAVEAIRMWRESCSDTTLQLVGIHFHLDGYSAAQRIIAIRQCLQLIDQLRNLGHPVRFLDMGGGLPVSYLEDEQQWLLFWRELRRSLPGDREHITFRNHGLGLVSVQNKIYGTPNVYPFFQRPLSSEWLGSVLDAPADDNAHNGSTIADAFRSRGLQLRCEPGRALLDGCGMTVAQVEFRKRQPNGQWFIGLSMNRTQCRTSSEEFLMDPLLIPQSGDRDHDSIEGYLVGQYCTESELLCLRRLQFPSGVDRGDLVVFPNTAGYFMHFLESRSHQFPLAKNVFIQKTDAHVDPIDL